MDAYREEGFTKDMMHTDSERAIHDSNHHTSVSTRIFKPACSRFYRLLSGLDLVAHS